MRSATFICELHGFRYIYKYVQNLSQGGLPYQIFFTLHNDSHVVRVLNLSMELIKCLGIEVNSCELFLLSAGVLLHDIGMFIPINEKDLKILRQFPYNNLPNADYLQTITTAIDKKKLEDYQTVGKYIRDYHNVRSGMEIRETDIIKKVIPKGYGVIALIAEGHRKVDLYSDKYNSLSLWGKEIRLRLLCAIERLADELDLYCERTPEALQVINSPIVDKTTKNHWLKHYAVYDIRLEANAHHQVRVNIIYKLHESIDKIMYINRLEELIRNGIIKEMDYVKDIFDEYSLFPIKLYTAPLDKDIESITESEIRSDLITSIIQKSQFVFNCPALSKFSPDSEVIIYEQDGRYICKYDEQKHKIGIGEFCLSNNNYICDCGFCAAYGQISANINTEFQFDCPGYSFSNSFKEVLIKQDTDKHCFICTEANSSEKTCVHCGFYKGVNINVNS